MADMLGPVSTWEDRGVERSGTLPSDWYTSPELYDLERRTLFREVWHCVAASTRWPSRASTSRARSPTSRSSSPAAATASCARCRTSACTAAARSPSAAGSARRSSARTTAGRSSSTAASAARRAWTARATSSLLDAPAAVPGRRLGPDGLGRAGAHGVAARHVARRRHAAARELPHRRDALRRRPALGDRLQLEALRRQLHGGLPHPLHPPGPRPEPQPDGLHLPPRRILERAVRRRAAPARPRLAGGRHPRRHAGAARAEAAARRASTSPRARATTSTGSSR